MAEDFGITFGTPVPTIFFQALQQMLSGAWSNITLVQTGAATLELPAGIGDKQASISIGNPTEAKTLFRWVTAPLTVVVSGTAGTYGIFACAAEADNYTSEEDHTNRAFTLAATKTTPGSVYSYRKIASVVFDGTYITKITMALGEPLSSLLGNIRPPGEVIAYAGATAPEGWLFCDGREVRISEYPALYDAIGTLYNAEYKTNFGSEVTAGYFALPDYRGRVPVGVDGMGITGRAFRLEATSGNPYELAQSGGHQTITLTTSQMPNHVHSLTVFDEGHYHTAPSGLYLAAWNSDPPNAEHRLVADLSMSGPETSSWNFFDMGNDTWSLSGTASATANIFSSLGGAGGGNYHLNTQPYIIQNFLIKT